MPNRLLDRVNGLARSRTGVLLTGQVVTAAAAFGINLLAARAMSTADRGFLALVLQLVYLATTVALLGVERPYAAASSASFGAASRDLVRVVRPATLVAAAACVAAAVSFAWPGASLTTTILLGCLFLVGNMHARMARTAFIVSGDGRAFVVSAVLPQAALLVAGVALAALSVGDPDAWLACYVGIGVVAFLVVRFYGRGAREHGSLTGPDLSTVRRQGFRLLPASLGNTAMLRSDRLLIPLLASTAELGLYVVVATALELAAWPVQQWADASLRRWRTEAANLRVGRVLLTSALVGTVMAVVLGIITHVIVTFWLPAAYSASLPLIPFLAAASVVYSVTRAQQAVLVARGRSGTVSAVEIGGMVISVALYLVLIPSQGAMGAAIASLLGYLACAVGGQFAVMRSSRPTSNT